MLAVAKKSAKVAGYSLGAGVACAAGVGGYLYATEPGCDRALRFWRHTGPIVVHYWWEKVRAKDDADKRSRYERLHAQHAPDARRCIEDLRGMFVKVGQVLSVRAEIVPDAYRSEFRALQDSVPAARWEPIQEVLERDLGAPLDELFEEVDKEPLGAASIGQAHLVRWRGRQVVVKVQYPEAASMLRADFWCLESLLWLLNEQDALKVVRQLQEQFRVELDYAQEARHLQELHTAVMSSPKFAARVAVPEPVPELTRGCVIGMEYLPGAKLETVFRERLEALGMSFQGQSIKELLVRGQRQEMAQVPMNDSAGSGGSSGSGSGSSDAPPASFWARLGRRALALTTWLLGPELPFRVLGLAAELKLRLARRRQPSEVAVATAELREMMRLLLDVHGFQLFFCPYFNADPHPGNILLLPDGRVGLIDFGQCRALQHGERQALAQLLVALEETADAAGSEARVAAAFVATGMRTEKSDERFQAFMANLMFTRLRPELLDRERMRETFKRDKMVDMPTHVIMAYRAAMLLRGLCLVLQENVSIAEAWEPWARRWLEEHGAPTQVPA